VRNAKKTIKKVLKKKVFLKIFAYIKGRGNIKKRGYENAK